MTKIHMPNHRYFGKRKRKPRNKTPHAILIEEIREFLTLSGIFHWKQWQGPMSQPSGASDILGCYKGKFLAIEAKRDVEVPTEDQQAFLDMVEDAGGIAILAHSVTDVIQGLGLEHKIK